MLLASKVKETMPLTTETLHAYTNKTVEVKEFVVLEKMLLLQLQWDLQVVTAVDFIDPILYNLSIAPQLREDARNKAFTFINLCCCDHKFSNYTPSLLASAAVGAAFNKMFRKQDSRLVRENVFKAVCDITGIETDMFMSCLEQVKSVDQFAVTVTDTHATEEGDDELVPSPTPLTQNPVSDADDIRMVVNDDAQLGKPQYYRQNVQQQQQEQQQQSNEYGTKPYFY